jgi:hypothetical protein
MLVAEASLLTSAKLPVQMKEAPLKVSSAGCSYTWCKGCAAAAAAAVVP